VAAPATILEESLEGTGRQFSMNSAPRQWAETLWDIDSPVSSAPAAPLRTKCRNPGHLILSGLVHSRWLFSSRSDVMFGHSAAPNPLNGDLTGGPR
jgi:hypothetical protein